MKEWISVEGRLPEIGKSILVHNQGFEHSRSVRMAFMTSNGFYDAYECGCGIKLYEVTHWMPLPDPPEKALKPDFEPDWNDGNNWT